MDGVGAQAGEQRLRRLVRALFWRPSVGPTPHDRPRRSSGAAQRGGGLPADAAAALPLYRRACDLRDAEGCYRLGGLYEHGRGVAGDLGRALALYRQACDLGDDQACDDRSRLAPPPR